MDYRKTIETLFGKTKGTLICERFPDVISLVDDGILEMQKIKGCSQNTYWKVSAALSLGRQFRWAVNERKLEKIQDPESVAALIQPRLEGLDREHFIAVLLNTKNMVIEVCTVAIGSLNAALVHPREIFKRAVVRSAAGMILVHNHPTGNPEPSREDQQLTERFAKCGELMGIELVDHIIIGDDNFVSLRERGLLEI